MLLSSIRLGVLVATGIFLISAIRVWWFFGRKFWKKGLVVSVIFLIILAISILLKPQDYTGVAKQKIEEALATCRQIESATQTDLEQLEKVLTEKQKELLELQDAQTINQATELKLKSVLKHIETELQALKEQKTTLTATLERKSAFITQLQCLYQLNAARIQEINNLLAQDATSMNAIVLREEKHKLEKDNLLLQQQITTLQAEIKALKTTNHHLDQVIQVKEAIFTQAQQDLTEVQQQGVKIIKDIKNYDNFITSLQQTIKDYQAQIEVLTMAIGELESLKMTLSSNLMAMDQTQAQNSLWGAVNKATTDVREVVEGFFATKNLFSLTHQAAKTGRFLKTAHVHNAIALLPYLQNLRQQIIQPDGTPLPLSRENYAVLKQNIDQQINHLKAEQTQLQTKNQALQIQVTTLKQPDGIKDYCNNQAHNINLLYANYTTSLDHSSQSLLECRQKQNQTQEAMENKELELKLNQVEHAGVQDQQQILARHLKKNPQKPDLKTYQQEIKKVYDKTTQKMNQIRK